MADTGKVLMVESLPIQVRKNLGGSEGKAVGKRVFYASCRKGATENCLIHMSDGTLPRKRRFLWREYTTVPTTVTLGELRFPAGQFGAEARWKFHYYGRQHEEPAKALAEYLAEEFRADINVVLVSERALE